MGLLYIKNVDQIIYNNMNQLPGTGNLKTIARPASLPFTSVLVFTQLLSVHAVSQTWGDYTLYSAQYCCHHDICPMPDGNVLLIN